MKSDKQFWDSKAKMYEYTIKFLDARKPYKLMYKFIKDGLTKGMQVLEVGTGTGLVAREVHDKVKSIEATDFSEEMIKQAKSIEHSSKINFSCADIFALPFDDNKFDTVIASNILHIIPTPEKAMLEIKRVLKPKGLLIAPTFLWEELSLIGKIQKKIMIKKKFPLYSQWNEQSFKKFISNNGFKVKTFQKIKASFALACVIAENIDET